MLRKYEIVLAIVFIGIFSSICLYVYGLISRGASLGIFLLGMSILVSFAITDNDFENSLCSLEYSEM